MTNITVLVAVYNAEDYLEQCLDSLLGQSLRNIQVVCIDDASTDRSPDILRRYAQADGRVCMLRMEENSGQAVARNRGLEMATGELTTMVDADDYLAPDALEQLWRAYRANPSADAAVLRLVRVYPDGRREAHHVPVTASLLTGREACCLSVDWRLHGYYAIRTDLHRRYPYHAERRVYTDDITPRQHYLHCREVALTEGTYYYRQHERSVTHRGGLVRLDLVEANCILRRVLEEEGAGAEALKRCEVYAWGVLLSVARELYASSDLTPAERRAAETRLADALATVRPCRLPLGLRLKPGYIPLRAYALFRGQQRAYLLLRRLSGRPL